MLGVICPALIGSWIIRSTEQAYIGAMTKQNPPAKKRRSRRKAEPRAIYNAIYYAEYDFGQKYCEEETLEEHEKAYAAGADVNEPGAFGTGTPPLLLAMEREYEGVVRWLLEHGADVQACDNQGYSAVHVVRNKSIMSLLLQFGANMNARNKRGETCLHIAMSGSTCKWLDYLLQHGADANLRSETYGTPLQHAIACNRYAGNVPRLIRALCDSGADIELPDEEGRTSLHLAARLGDIISAQALLENGADISARDGDGCYALWYMPRYFHFANPDIVQLLTPNSTSHES